MVHKIKHRISKKNGMTQRHHIFRSMSRFIRHDHLYINGMTKEEDDEMKNKPLYL